jgi:hypothetical protein
MLMQRVARPQDRSFRPDKVWVYIYVLALCLTCWAGAYAVSLGIPVEGEESGTLLWQGIQSLLSDKTVMYVVGLLMMLVCAGMIFLISHNMFLVRERTLLPLIICILLFSTGEHFIPLKPGGIATLCMALSIHTLLTSYHNPQSIKAAYITGFIMGTGSLFWGYILWFFPLIWITMYRFLSLTGKTFSASLLGVGSVYWMVLGVCVVTDNYDFLLQLASTLADVHPFSLQDIRWTEWGTVVCYTLFTIMAVLCTFRRRFDENKRMQSFYIFLLQYTGLVLILFLLYPSPVAQEALQCFCIPAAILLADFFATQRSRWTFWMFQIMVVSLSFFLFIRVIELWNLS